MNNILKRMTSVVAAAVMASAMMIPAYAAQTSLLETKDGKSISDATLKDTDLSEYSEMFAAMGATPEQVKTIKLESVIHLKVGETRELLMAQPARAKDENAPLELLAGAQVAVSVGGPADGSTVKNANGAYLPLTFTGKAEGTDVYVSAIEPFGLCAYKFVVGSGKGVTNTDPELYTVTPAVELTPAEEIEDSRYLTPTPNVKLITKGSKYPSVGFLKPDDK